MISMNRVKEEMTLKKKKVVMNQKNKKNLKRKINKINKMKLWRKMITQKFKNNYKKKLK